MTSAKTTSDSVKNPEREAENPAPMPKSRQGESKAPKPHDPEGQQGGQTHAGQTHAGQSGGEHRAKMAVHSDSPPGIELDGKAHIIPLDQRTEGDRRKALEQKK